MNRDGSGRFSEPSLHQKTLCLLSIAQQYHVYVFTRLRIGTFLYLPMHWLYVLYLCVLDLLVL